MSEPRCAGCERTSPPAPKLHRAKTGALFVCDGCVEECVTAIADAPTRIPGATRNCGFCGKAEDRVAVMLVLGSSLICDECVDSYNPTLAR